MRSLSASWVKGAPLPPHVTADTIMPFVAGRLHEVERNLFEPGRREPQRDGALAGDLIVEVRKVHAKHVVEGVQAGLPG